MTWFTFTLLSQLFLVVSAFLSKKFLNHSTLDPKIFGGFSQLLVGLIALVFALLTGFTFHFTPASILMFFLMVVTYVVGTSFYFIGLKHVDISLVTILDSSASIWTLLIGVFILAESFTVSKLIGLVLIMAAVILVSLNPRSLHISFNKFEKFLLLYSVMNAFAAALDNQLVSFSNAISYMAISFTSVGAIMLLVNFRALVQKPYGLINSQFTIVTLLVISSLSFAAFYCVMYAYELHGEISSMMPIQQLSGVTVPLVGILFLKERHKIPQKLIAACLAFIGVIFINK